MAKHILTVADISDLHCGGATALMPPSWTNADGLEIRQNRAQAWLWERWQDLAQRIKREAMSGVEVFGLFNGDIVEGRHHETPQLVSVEPEDHADIATECVDMVAAWCKRLMFIAGTDAHVGHQGRTENIVAKTFAAQGKEVVKPKDTALHVWPVALANIGGIEFNIAHHIRGGGLEHTRNNAANAEAAWQAVNAKFLGLPVPRYVLRGHTHFFARGHYDRTGTETLVTGCWQLSTSHGHRIKPHITTDIGARLIRIYDDGTSTDEKAAYEVIRDHRHIVRIEYGTHKTSGTGDTAGANTKRTAGAVGKRQSGRSRGRGASGHSARIRDTAQSKRRTGA